jgi:hypothetical protein
MIERPREEIWDHHPANNNYHPRPMLRDKNISVSSQEFILIPTLAYRVSAPEIKRTELNALQKVVLRFCLAGEYRPGEISRRLNIHVEFAAFINSELQEKGLIDTKGAITETGTEALKMEEVQSDNLVTGWILKDTIQNRLWPRFVKEANRVESSISERGKTIVDLGTPGKPRAVQCWKIKWSSPNDYLPNPNEIMEAVYQNGRDFDFHSRRSSRNRKRDEEVDNQHNLKPADLKRVQIIDPTPRRVHLLSYIYFAREDPSRFFAADPFGMGNSRFFFDSLRVERNRNSALDDFLNRYVEKNRQRVIDRSGLSSPELHATNREALKNRYGWNQSRLIGFSKIMYAPLFGVEMQYALLEDADKKKLATEVLTKALLNQCRISFEAFIAAMLEWYPPHEPWRKFYKEKVRKKYNPDPKSGEIAFIELEKVYLDLGCDPADIDDRFLPNRSRKYDPSKLKETTHLISKGRYKGGLNHLINILAIEAEKKPDHPFREILEMDQCWDSMVFLMDAGNEGSHYKKPSDGELKTQDAYRAREQIHLLVKKLTEVSAMNKDLNQQKVVT